MLSKALRQEFCLNTRQEYRVLVQVTGNHLDHTIGQVVETRRGNTASPFLGQRYSGPHTFHHHLISIQDKKRQKVGIQENSPYRKLFTWDRIESGEGEAKEWFLPALVNILEKSFMPLYPLWCDLHQGEKDRQTVTRYSKAPVEAWIKEVSHTSQKKKRHFWG